MEESLIEKNAEAAESAARQSISEANDKAFKFSDLLIKIAFAVGGLAATRVVANNLGLNLANSKLGIIFLGISIISGGIQMMLERYFFRKNGELFNNVAVAFKEYRSSKEDVALKDKAIKSIEDLSRSSKRSSELPLYLQIVFVILGVLFILFDVFFIRINCPIKFNNENGSSCSDQIRPIHKIYNRF